MALSEEKYYDDNHTQQIDVVVDAFGLLCPLPVIKASNQLKKLKIGQILELISTDRGVVKDMKDWCTANGHAYLSDEQAGRIIKVWMKKMK